MANYSKDFMALKRAVLEREFGRMNEMQRKAVFTTQGPLLTNLIFDMVVPYHFRMTDRETAVEIDRLVKERLGERYYTVATVERSYVWSGE